MSRVCNAMKYKIIEMEKKEALLAGSSTAWQSLSPETDYVSLVFLFGYYCLLINVYLSIASIAAMEESTACTGNPVDTRGDSVYRRLSRVCF